MQLCGNDNMIVADCTTPANFFHLLRRQMKRDFRKPLIVFTPKSLLRYPKAVSSLEELGSGEFQEVIEDNIDPETVKKLIFCTGKFYYELLAERGNLERKDVALVRIEQLFPLHLDKIQAIIAKYPNVESYAWAQEEPRNMGAYSHVLMHFDEARQFRSASRRPYGAPAAGSAVRSKKRHKEVIDFVFDKTKNNQR